MATFNYVHEKASQHLATSHDAMRYREGGTSNKRLVGETTLSRVCSRKAGSEAWRRRKRLPQDVIDRWSCLGTNGPLHLVGMANSFSSSCSLSMASAAGPTPLPVRCGVVKVKGRRPFARQAGIWAPASGSEEYSLGYPKMCIRVLSRLRPTSPPPES